MWKTRLYLSKNEKKNIREPRNSITSAIVYNCILLCKLLVICIWSILALKYIEILEIKINPEARQVASVSINKIENSVACVTL